MGISLFCILFYFYDSVFCTSPRTIAVAVVREYRLIDWHELLCNGLLENTVFDCWNTKLSYSTVWFRDFYSPYRVWAVFSPIYPLDNGFLILPKICTDFFYGYSIDSRCSLVCLYSLKSSVQVILVQYLLQEFRLCTVSFLPYPVEGAMRSHISFMFRTILLQAAFSVFCIHLSFLLSRLY